MRRRKALPLERPIGYPSCDGYGARLQGASHAGIVSPLATAGRSTPDASQRATSAKRS
jgi:hypothetical protein